MFNTTGKSAKSLNRSENTLKKLDRLMKTLNQLQMLK